MVRSFDPADAADGLCLWLHLHGPVGSKSRVRGVGSRYRYRTVLVQYGVQVRLPFTSQINTTLRATQK